MDLVPALTVCLRVANGKKTGKRQGRIAVAALHVAMNKPDAPSEKQLPVLRAFVELYREGKGVPPSGRQVRLRAKKAYGTCHEQMQILIRKGLVERRGQPAQWRNLHPTEWGLSFIEK